VAEGRAGAARFDSAVIGFKLAGDS
jgi:hypothetical protein